MSLILLLTCANTVFAKEFDTDKTGSITVTLTDKSDNEAIVGAKLSLYYIATVVINADGNPNYEYTENFKDFNTAIDDTALVTKLDTFVSVPVTVRYAPSPTTFDALTYAEKVYVCPGVSVLEVYTELTPAPEAVSFADFAPKYVSDVSKANEWFDDKVRLQ